MRTRQQRFMARPITTVGTLLLLAACDAPAPGEGIGPLMKGPMPEVVGAREAVQMPDIPAIDPQTLHEAEIEKVLGPGPRCAFAYTAESPPVLAIAMADGASGAHGVIKIHGRLVELSDEKVLSREALADGAVLIADGASVDVAPVNPDEARGAEPGERLSANLHFELEQGLRVGYRGWYSCWAEQRQASPEA